MASKARDRQSVERAAWGVAEWAAAVGLGTTYVRAQMDAGTIPNIQVSTRRLITVSPAAWVAWQLESGS